MSSKNQMTMFTAAVATGVLVAAGTSAIGGDGPTRAAPNAPSPVVVAGSPVVVAGPDVALMATPNPLFGALSGFGLGGGSTGTGGTGGTTGQTSGGTTGNTSGGTTGNTSGGGGGSPSLFFAPTIFGAGAAADTGGGGGPTTAATLLSPTPSPFQVGGLIGNFIGSSSVTASTPLRSTRPAPATVPAAMPGCSLATAAPAHLAARAATAA